MDTRDEPLWSSYSDGQPRTRWDRAINRYFWYYACQRGCTVWKESPDPAGDRQWATAVCPYCGTPLAEMSATGHDG